MAHESFENEHVAEQLNRDFISIKVDKEERPDIDGVYMRFCQAMTGSGGWPTSLFMTADGKAFFAGTYFPTESFLNLLASVATAWKQNRVSLLKSSDQITAAIHHSGKAASGRESAPVAAATEQFRTSYDPEYGGFGAAPKFPSPHNLMFLLYTSPDMAEKTLLQMYLGGIFDHIGGGFSRYSTDPYWLAPHFEKMLYDNALLAMAYLLAHEMTGKVLYRTVAERVFSYLERDMRDRDGGFFSAQDADSDGVEGKFYLFRPDELASILGPEDGARFCRHFGITPQGNFEGKSIPNLLGAPQPDLRVEALLPKVYEYRKGRTALHTDTKLLTGWNALTGAAYAMAFRLLKQEAYGKTARETLGFMERELTNGDTVFVGSSGKQCSGPGFLDDYAFYIFALIQMHQATLEDSYLMRAVELAEKTISSFWDQENGGFFFSGAENETLIARPKENWDGAIPSGNSVMAYNLSRLSLLTDSGQFEAWAEQQRRFMNGEAAAYPSGYGFYLYASLPVKSVTCVLGNPSDLNDIKIKSNWAFRLVDSEHYPLVNGKTTFYICENGACLPPSNTL